MGVPTTERSSTFIKIGDLPTISTPMKRTSSVLAARALLAAAMLTTSLAGCANVPSRASSSSYSQTGMVSYYGHELAGRRTASGEVFNPSGLTMAHRTLPLGTRVRVTDVRTQRSVVVRVNDRGPFRGNRVADLSLGAAQALGMVGRGTIQASLALAESDD